jgi:hypothetical protein
MATLSAKVRSKKVYIPQYSRFGAKFSSWLGVI